MPIQEDPLQSKDAMAAFIQRARSAGKSDDEIRAFVTQKRNAYTPLQESATPQLPMGSTGLTRRQMDISLG
jgi:hypothetical protein